MSPVMLQAGGQGFEPQPSDPESEVLPLNYPPVCLVPKGKYTTVRAQQQILAPHFRQQEAAHLNKLNHLQRICLQRLAGIAHPL